MCGEADQEGHDGSCDRRQADGQRHHTTAEGECAETQTVGAVGDEVSFFKKIKLHSSSRLDGSVSTDTDRTRMVRVISDCVDAQASPGSM